MSEEDLKSSSRQDNKVPGRTVGFSVMTAIIGFVAIWMGIQGDLLRDSSDKPNNENAEFLSAELGFQMTLSGGS